MPCKIRFSSADTLKCHQQYYCPARGENASVSPVGNGVIASLPTGLTEDTHQCLQCSQVFPSVRLLKSHVCSASSSTRTQHSPSNGGTASSRLSQIHVPMLRCPYCEYVTQSDARLVEHIKAHAPTRAYKCALCGYRGNTVRGMRMHGKLHADGGEPFTDEHMLVVEQPALIPKRFRTTFGDASALTTGGLAEGESSSLEAELIRLKNEPYKRRRSRKCYEKSENRGPNARRAPMYTCPLCGHLCMDAVALGKS